MLKCLCSKGFGRVIAGMLVQQGFQQVIIVYTMFLTQLFIFHNYCTSSITLRNEINRLPHFANAFSRKDDANSAMYFSCSSFVDAKYCAVYVAPSSSSDSSKRNNCALVKQPVSTTSARCSSCIHFTHSASISQATFEVTGTGSNGCTNTDQVTIFVNNAPNVSAGPDRIICNGQTITLTGSGASSYDWDNGAVNGVAFTPVLGTTTYTVTGTNAGGCTAQDQMTVTVNQLPNVSIATIPIFCLSDGSAALTQGIPSGGDYTGMGITGVVFSPATAGLGIHPVSYKFTDSNGCSNTANGTITVDQCLGLNTLAENHLSVYPNPTTGLTVIEFPGTFNYVVSDAQGRIVLDGSASEGTKLDLTSFSDGVYQLTIQAEDTAITVRVVKN